jgi:hypothetical protein
MRARRFIDGASLDPLPSKRIGEAFDRAWADIADHFPATPPILTKPDISSPPLYWPSPAKSARMSERSKTARFNACSRLWGLDDIP